MQLYQQFSSLITNREGMPHRDCCWEGRTGFPGVWLAGLWLPVSVSYSSLKHGVHHALTFLGKVCGLWIVEALNGSTLY